MNSLGIDKETNKTRVVVAMSGGVDSSVTAALLAEQGYDVVGVTLKLHDFCSASSETSCCADKHILDAQRVADALKIKHFVLDFRTQFHEKIVDYFADSYLGGETPIPCAHCNRKIKFGELLFAARDLGADALATGHYVRRLEGTNGPELHCAVDESRDQSYFLFATSREQLDFLRFPLGDLRKTEVRVLAERFKLPTATKPDSQDICFVPDGDYAAFINKIRPGSLKAGEIVDQDGNVLGEHEGVTHFTVGQRRGLDLSDRKGENNEPLFVLRLEPESHRVVVGPRVALAQTEVVLRDVNWLADPVPEEGLDVTVRLRSAQLPLAAKVYPVSGEGTLSLVLKTAAYGIAPGQAGVIYQGSRILGGGWITKPKRT